MYDNTRFYFDFKTNEYRWKNNKNNITNNISWYSVEQLIAF